MEQTEGTVADRKLRSRWFSSWAVTRLSLQLAIAAVFLIAWQFVPTVHVLSEHFRVFDPFFISSPVAVWQNLVDLSFGRNASSITIWPYLWTTVYSSLLGSTIG